MGDALDPRRYFAVIAGVFLISLSSVGLSAHKDLSIADNPLAIQAPQAGARQGVASRWGKWSCSLITSTAESCQLSNTKDCQPCGDMLATDAPDLTVDAAAGNDISPVELSVDGRGSAGNCIWVSDAISFAHILTVGGEIMNEPCAVPLKAFQLDVGYEFSESNNRNNSYFGSDVAASTILR